MIGDGRSPGRLWAVGLIFFAVLWGGRTAYGQSMEYPVDVLRPAPGETVTLLSEPGQTFNLTFPPDMALVAVEGDNLVFGFDDNGDDVVDSRIVFQNLINVARTANPPIFTVAGTPLGADVLIDQALALAGSDDAAFETAAGGTSGYIDDLGSLIDRLAARDETPPAVGQADPIDVARPGAGQTITIQAKPGQSLNLTFPPHLAQVVVEEPDFILGFDDDGDGLADSRIVFQNLVTVAEGENPPIFTVAGTVIESKLLINQAVALADQDEHDIDVGSQPPPSDDALPARLTELRYSGRDLLFPGETERAGHPLYSYLLYAGASGGEREERLRFKAAIEAFIGEFRPATELVSRGAAREQINIFYAPMRAIFEDTTPESMRIHFAMRKPDDQTALLRDRYDYARARVLIGQMRRSGDGPYIVSVLRPLSLEAIDEDEAFLLQDLSSVPPDLVALWVDEFKRQVLKEAIGSPEYLRRIALHLRTYIGTLAEGFAITRSAVAEMFEEPKRDGDGN